MKTTMSVAVTLTLALSLCACSHKGPSDAEASQAFQNFGWARAGLPSTAKDKVRVHACTADASTATMYTCQITVDGFAGAKANIPFKKNADGTWAVNL